jgi:spore germination protein GerM
MKLLPRLLTALAVLALAASGGCGEPSGAIVIPEEDLPFTLARTPASPSPSGDGTPITVFFVDEGRLAPVTRQAASDLTPEEGAMRALLAGPTQDERPRGVTSEIPVRTSLLGVQNIDLVVEVDLSAEFQSPAPPHAIVLRVAQVVWTLVTLPEVSAVRFLIDGEPVSVVADNGTAVDRPVAAPDYAAVAPR